MKKEKSDITQEYGFLKVGNKYYKPSPDGERLNYKEVTKKQFDNQVKLLKQIANKLKDSLDRELVLIEALSKLDDDILEKIWGKLNLPNPQKAKTRKHHCVDMKIGGVIIPIVE